MGLSSVAAPTRPDGGVSPVLARDGGVEESKAQGPAPASSAELERLKRDLQDLRARTTELEQKVRQVDAVERKVDEVKKELATLSERVTANEDTRRDAERAVVEQKQRVQQATQGLVVADQQLASGNTESVSRALQVAEASYTGAALKYVQAARTSFSNGDLASTRTLLSLAVLEAQNQRGP